MRIMMFQLSGFYCRNLGSENIHKPETCREDPYPEVTLTSSPSSPQALNPSTLPYEPRARSRKTLDSQALTAYP